MAKYEVTYVLYGVVEVDARDIKEAEDYIYNKISDRELFRGVDGGGNIDGDSIEVKHVENTEER